MAWQLKIDFTIPYELTPTYEEINWTILNYGETDIPFTEYKQKKNKKKIN